jgi:hypothetical protein
VGYDGVVLVGHGAEYGVVDEEFDYANFDHTVEVCVYGRRHSLLVLKVLRCWGWKKRIIPKAPE